MNEYNTVHLAHLLEQKQYLLAVSAISIEDPTALVCCWNIWLCTSSRKVNDFDPITPDICNASRIGGSTYAQVNLHDKFKFNSL